MGNLGAYERAQTKSRRGKFCLDESLVANNYSIFGWFRKSLFSIRQMLVRKKLVSAPQRIHMGMLAGGYFIITNHYFMTSLSLINISNCYTNIQNAMVIA